MSMLGAWISVRRVLAGTAAPGNGSSVDNGEVVHVDLSDIAPGEVLRVDWDDKPVFVRHRTANEIEQARSIETGTLPDPEADIDRVKRPEWLVVTGICTHGGCIPRGPLGRFGGWYCLCHGSQFDTSGRVRIGPARDNLGIPPYRFVSDSRIAIGEGAADQATGP